MKNYELIKNKNNNNNLICDGYIYNADNRENRKGNWRCSIRKCRSIGSVNENEFFLHSEHNHEPNKKNMKMKKAIAEIKYNAEKTLESNMKIVTDVTSKLDENIVAYMPKFKNLLDKCTKLKNKRNSHIKSNFNDIPTCLTRDLRDNKFLQFDSGVDSPKRFTIFFSSENAKLLASIRTVLIDGTFWSVPSNYTQLLTINCYVFGKHFPVCFILMSDKSEENYCQAFEKFLELTNCFFENIIIDFEMSLKNSIKKVFYKSRLFGCSFHFGQSIYRKVQNLNLSNDYINNLKVKKFIRDVLNLVYVPADKVKETFCKMVNFAEKNFNGRLDKFLKYFKNTYVGSVDKSPFYEIDFWNCNLRVLLNIPRTTNSVEAWHRSLNFKCNILHLNLRRFLEILIQENEKIRVTLLQTRHEISINKDFLEKEEKIRRIVLSYYCYEEWEFFNAISKVMVWMFN